MAGHSGSAQWNQQGCEAGSTRAAQHTSGGKFHPNADANCRTRARNVTVPAVLDVDLGIETDRLALAARHRDQPRVGIPKRLEHRFGRAPERHVALQPAVVMGQHEYVGLVGPDML